MPRMPKYLKREWAFFLGDCGRKKYNPLNGRVLAAYDTQQGTIQGLDKSGTAYRGTTSWDVYGVMDLAALLNGSSDFTPLQFTF